MVFSNVVLCRRNEDVSVSFHVGWKERERYGRKNII